MRMLDVSSSDLDRRKWRVSLMAIKPEHVDRRALQASFEICDPAGCRDVAQHLWSRVLNSDADPWLCLFGPRRCLFGPTLLGSMLNDRDGADSFPRHPE